jgi:hypothetical protein
LQCVDAILQCVGEIFKRIFIFDVSMRWCDFAQCVLTSTSDMEHIEIYTSHTKIWTTVQRAIIYSCSFFYWMLDYILKKTCLEFVKFGWHSTDLYFKVLNEIAAII